MTCPWELVPSRGLGWDGLRMRGCGLAGWVGPAESQSHLRARGWLAVAEFLSSAETAAEGVTATWRGLDPANSHHSTRKMKSELDHTFAKRVWLPRRFHIHYHRWFSACLLGQEPARSRSPTPGNHHKPWTPCSPGTLGTQPRATEPCSDQ